jgi:hypothetical protein
MKMIDRGELDVAVIDINVHGELADPIAEELRRQQIPFTFATGYDAQSIPRRFRDVRCWRKRFEPAAIVNELAVLCERSAKKIVPIDPKG